MATSSRTIVASIVIGRAAQNGDATRRSSATDPRPGARLCWYLSCPSVSRPSGCPSECSLIPLRPPARASEAWKGGSPLQSRLLRPLRWSELSPLKDLSMRLGVDSATLPKRCAKSGAQSSSQISDLTSSSLDDRPRVPFAT